MITFATAFLVALLVAGVLTPLVRHLSYRLGFYDPPDERKVHARLIPRTGGVAIVLAFLAPIVGIALTEARIGDAIYSNSSYVLGMIVGGLLIIGVGLADDLRGLGAKRKLLLQVLAATVAYAAGFRIEAVSLPLGNLLDMGVFSYVVTVVWIVGIVNAMNLIDGLDGLAAGIGLFVLVLNFVQGWYYSSILVCMLAASLAGAIVGFLVYNFNPASIFMGDSGSMLIGYVLALGSINSGQKSSTTVALLTPIVAMGVPIMDTLFSMVRRFLERRSMFSPDRGHIHHRLLEMGLTHRRVVLVLYGFSVVLVLAASLLQFGRTWQVGVALLTLVAVLFAFARIVGFVDYVRGRRERRMGIRQRHAEILRKLVYDALVRADRARSGGEALEFLRWFMEAAEIKFVEVHCGTPAGAVLLRNEKYPEQRRKPLLVTEIPLLDPA
ncbi:MAG: undecaprenyl/decaprenyl-phosphate alpha-N-acetylglucosaminyl 1-phosphate transferase, partial [Deltaproteobacteria bacterium]|nr:undecaprenyl/decaprenyl-phosphate alpha-N-acetylglucosaminyl 1-phosphate transferase [Deltaproteobacteria bacterium]